MLRYLKLKMSRKFNNLRETQLADANQAKFVDFDMASATSSTTATIAFSQTSNRTYTFPDASGTISLASGTEQIESGSVALTQYTDFRTSSAIYASSFSSAPKVVTSVELTSNADDDQYQRSTVLNSYSRNITTSGFDITATADPDSEAIRFQSVYVSRELTGLSTAYHAFNQPDGNPAYVCNFPTTNTIALMMQPTAAGTSNQWMKRIVLNYDSTSITALRGATINGNIFVAILGTSEIILVGFVNGRRTVSSFSTIREATYFDFKEVTGKPALCFYVTSPTNKLVYAINSAADASGTWTFVDVYSGGGEYCSMAVVNGFPAIAFRRSGAGGRYASNSSTDGTGTWTSYQFNGATDWGFESLIEFNSLPLIAYSEEDGSDLYAATCSNASGSGTWTNTLIDGTNLNISVSAALVNGRPAIAVARTIFDHLEYFYNPSGTTWNPETIAVSVTNNNPAYLVEANSLPWVMTRSNNTIIMPEARRNTSADGSGTWSTISPSTSYTTAAGERPSAANIGGYPAFVSSDPPYLQYHICRTTDGRGAWDSIWMGDFGISNGAADGRQWVGFAEVAGNPAVSTQNVTTADLWYARCSNSDGTGTWTQTLVDASTSNVGRYSVMTVVSGTPAIAYQNDTNEDLKFARNANADGSGAWTISTAYNDTNVGNGISMLIVNGVPALTFVSTTTSDLLYVYNDNATGTGTWNVQELGQVYTGNNFTANLSIVDGNPAVVYMSDASNLVYQRAFNVSGSGPWSRHLIDNLSVSLTNEYQPRILDVDGRPFLFGRRTNSGGDTFSYSAASATGQGGVLGDRGNGKPDYWRRFDNWTPGASDDLNRFTSIVTPAGNPICTDTDRSGTENFRVYANLGLGYSVHYIARTS